MSFASIADLTPREVELLAERIRELTLIDGPVPVHFPQLGPCSLWVGRLGSGGYPEIGAGRRGRSVRVHRFVLEMTLGRPLGLGEQSLHRCDTPPCIRLEHLFPGTNADNRADMVANGRHRPGRSPGDRNAARKYPGLRQGERNGRHRLTKVQVRAVRRQAKAGVPLNVLAATYHVSDVAVSLAVRRITWSHVA